MSSHCTRSHRDYMLEREQAAWYQRYLYSIYGVPGHHLCLLCPGITYVWIFTYEYEHINVVVFARYEVQYFWYLVPGRKQGTKENKKMVLTNQVHLWYIGTKGMHKHRFYSTLDVDLSDSWASKRNLLFPPIGLGLLYPRCIIALQVNFLFFSYRLLSFSSLGHRDKILY